MKLRNLVLFILPALLVSASCSKDNFDPEKQAQQDESVIVKFLADKNIVAQRHTSGFIIRSLTRGQAILRIVVIQQCLPDTPGDY